MGRAQKQVKRDYENLTRRAEEKHGAGTGAALVRYHKKRTEGRETTHLEKQAHQEVKDSYTPKRKRK
jgi:hypothetical protein